MNKTVNDINIEKIMTEIRQAIKLKNYDSLPVTFDNVCLTIGQNQTDFNINNFNECVHRLNSKYYVVAYRNIVSRSGILGKFIIFVKKVLRKSIKFYIEPIVESQNEFNANVTQSINEIRKYIHETQTNKDELNFEISKLELDLNKNIKKPIKLHMQDNNKIKNDNICILKKLDHFNQEMTKQKEENNYLKRELELLAKSNKILEMEVKLLKNMVEVKL